MVEEKINEISISVSSRGQSYGFFSVLPRYAWMKKSGVREGDLAIAVQLSVPI